MTWPVMTVPIWSLVVVAVCWWVGWWMIGRLIRDARVWGMRTRKWVVIRWLWLFMLFALIGVFVGWWLSE